MRHHRSIVIFSDVKLDFSVLNLGADNVLLLKLQNTYDFSSEVKPQQIGDEQEPKFDIQKANPGVHFHDNKIFYAENKKFENEVKDCRSRKQDS